MKTLFWIVVVLIGLLVLKRLLTGPLLSPAEAMGRVEAGDAILVDVREPAEWTAGVVETAHLLPLSDLKGPRNQWGPVLQEHGDKEWILYCRSGNRSGVASRLLQREGFRAANAGGFSAWIQAGEAIRIPE